MARQVRAREFNAQGIAEARRFLAEVRRNPTGRKTPPEELLLGARYTRSFRGGLTVDSRWHGFGSRREIGEYLAPRLAPFRARIADRTSFWSWLGIFHFEDTVRIVDGTARLSPLDETFVIDRLDRQNLRGMHRHYLRSAWLLWETHREDAAFLLDQPPWARGGIANEVFQSQRIFNSAGVVQLVLRPLHERCPVETRIPGPARRAEAPAPRPRPARTHTRRVRHEPGGPGPDPSSGVCALGGRGRPDRLHPGGSGRDRTGWSEGRCI